MSSHNLSVKWDNKLMLLTTHYSLHMQNSNQWKKFVLGLEIQPEETTIYSAWNGATTQKHKLFEHRWSMWFDCRKSRLGVLLLWKWKGWWVTYTWDSRTNIPSKKEPHYNLSITLTEERTYLLKWKKTHLILSNTLISNDITYKLKINGKPKIKTWLLEQRNKDSQTAGRGSMTFSLKIAEKMKHTCWKQVNCKSSTESQVISNNTHILDRKQLQKVQCQKKNTYTGITYHLQITKI